MSKDPDNIMRLDRDIMASYVRELYDSILSDDATNPAVQEVAAPRKASQHRQVDPPTEVSSPPAVSAPPIIVAVPPPSQPIQEDTPVPASPPPVLEPKPQPVMAYTPKNPEPVPGGLEMLFEEKQAKELSEKLSELPIADLKKAIALNDRLLLTSELFAGDGKAFESAIGGINVLSNFDEAQSYLIEHCVVRYAWTDKKRLDSAKNFIKLVRRRFK